MDTVNVYGHLNPVRFAGFPDFASFLAYLESTYSNKNGDEPGDSDSPVEPDDDPGYTIDPALAALMASPEFHKLNALVKTEILKDQNLIEAFAKFINNNGIFVMDNSTESATWQGGPPPVITLPDSFLNPMSHYAERSIFALAHEIYHNEFQTLSAGQPITAQQWAHNEAVATLAAYHFAMRIDLPLNGDGYGAKQGMAISIMKNSANDAAAMQGLEDFYVTVAPPNLQ